MKMGTTIRAQGLCIGIGLLAATASAAPAWAIAGFEMLAPHRAVYDLRLVKATERSGIAAMNGRIVYEVTGNACEGVSVRYRFVTNITSAEDSYQTDQQTSTFETPDGKEFTFVTKTYVDQMPEKVVKGTAMLAGEGLQVDLDAPSKRSMELKPAVFITTHLVDLVEAAQKGENFLKREVFDGSGEADEVVTSTAVIGAARKSPEPREGEDAASVSLLDGQETWPVSVSYFDSTSNADSSESLPAYEAAFLLYGNGVSRHLVMRYPDYTLEGELASLEILNSTPCKK